MSSIIPTVNDFLKKDMNLPDSDKALDFDKLIDYWLFYIEDVHLAESPIDILYRDTNRIPSQHNITFLSQAFREEIKKNKKKLLKNNQDEVCIKQSVFFVPKIITFTDNLGVDVDSYKMRV